MASPPRRAPGRGRRAAPPAGRAAPGPWQAPLAALEALAARPWTWLAVVWAVNAVVRPYLGITHDARLYAFGVLDRLEGGAFAGDLFLRGGSQDRYTLFSPLLAPLAGLVGIDAAFFVVYEAARLLFWWAALRLVRALAPDRVAPLGVLVAAAAALPYGGFAVFRVHEPFLTPRLPASALVLLGLERLLAGRPAVALALVVGAGALHPLMALGGLLAAGAWLAAAAVGTQGGRVAAIAAAAAALGVLLVPAIGVRAFGTMDAEWLALVREVNRNVFPGEWVAGTWLHAAASLGIVLGAAWLLRAERPAAARLLGAVAAAGAAGVALAVAAAAVPYALLLQAQPARALWIAAALEWPLGLVLAARLAARPGLAAPLLGATIVLHLAVTRATAADVVAVLAFPAAIGVLRAAGALPAVPGRRRAVVAGGAAVWLVALTGAHLWYVIVHAPALAGGLRPLEYLHAAGEILGPAVCLAPALLWLARPAGERRRVGWVAAALGGAAVLAAFGVTRLADRAPLDLVRTALPPRAPGAPAPTVYTDWARLDEVWLGLRARSYFHPEQVVGSLFSRETAREGRRRALVVRAFEASHLRLPWVPVRVSAGAPSPRPRPAADDLRRLCREDVDVVALRAPVPGPVPVASDGLVRVYDCARLRADRPAAAPGARAPAG